MFDREAADLRYGHEYLGAGPDTLKELVDGTNKFTAKLKRAKKPMIIIGRALWRAAMALAFSPVLPSSLKPLAQ